MLPEELRAFVTQMGQPAYRADQLCAWIYGKGEADINAMTNLSKQFREELQQVAWVSQLREVERQEARNGEAVKFLFALPTGEQIEAVLIVDGTRRTVCLSSQVGCPLDCKFCATGKMGFIANLEAGQIVDQLLHIVRFAQARDERITNVVMMGMGEPLLNFDPVVRAGSRVHLVEYRRHLPDQDLGVRSPTWFDLENNCRSCHVASWHFSARITLALHVFLAQNRLRSPGA